MILYSTNGDADRAFLRDVLGFPHVDVGRGWLIFALPESEIAVHPAERGSHEIYLMVSDVRAFVADMASRGITCGAPEEQGWGVVTQLTLPGGGHVGVYEPRHARPPKWPVAGARKMATSRRQKPATRKAAKRRGATKARRRVATKKAKPARRGKRR
jgi:hypothetical protein